MDNQLDKEIFQHKQVNQQRLQGQIKQQSPLQLSSHNQQYPRSFTHPDEHNFIKSVRNGYGNSFICIYEDRPFTVQFRNFNNYQKGITKLIKYQQQNSHGQIEYQFQDISLNDKYLLGQLHFQSVPYDCLQFKQNSWIVSTKGMPPRIYKKFGQGSNRSISHMGSISNKKKNSEQYLAPIQMTSHEKKRDYAFGGGKKFLCSYNLQLGIQDLHLQSFDKVNVSTLEMITFNTLLVGNFQGGICLVDLRNQQTSMKIQQSKKKVNNSFLRPHVDAVMSLASNQQNQNIFASCARKDNYIYIWDCRMYGGDNTKYVAQLVTPRKANQRISLNFHNNGKVLYTGSQHSQIIGWHYQQNRLQKWKVQQRDNQVINSVLYKKEENLLLFSSGSRKFEQINDTQQQIAQLKDRKQKNLLGVLKL